MCKRKVQVEYYNSDGEEGGAANGEKQTVEMYDLMLKKGTKVKAFSRQEEEQRQTLKQLQSLGISSIQELDKQMLEVTSSKPAL